MRAGANDCCFSNSLPVAKASISLPQPRWRWALGTMSQPSSREQAPISTSTAKLDNSGTRSISAPTTTDPVTFGYSGWNDRYPGVLDEVRIYNRALASDEIAGLASLRNELPWDTDGDGIPDYLEDRNGNGVYDTGDLANFNSSDTDSDGMSDGQEIQLGTNPNLD